MEWRFFMKQKVNNINIAYSEYGAGDNLWIIMHGNRDKKEYLDNIALKIATQPNNRVLNIDLRGHGNSDKPDICYSMGMIIEDVIEFILLQKVNKVNLVGHSLGATVAMIICTENRIKVDKLVLISASAFFTPKFRPVNLNNYDIISIQEIHENAKKYMFSAKYPNVINKVIGYWSAIPEGVHKSILGIKHPDLREIVKNIKSETLIICGEKDNSTPVSDAEYLAQNINNACLKIIPGCSHFVVLEEPVQVEELVYNFIC